MKDSLLNVILIHKLRGTLMCLAFFLLCYILFPLIQYFFLNNLKQSLYLTLLGVFSIVFDHAIFHCFVWMLINPITIGNNSLK